MTDNLVQRAAIDSLLTRFAKNTYKPKYGDAQNEAALKRCLDLFARDYEVKTISNTSGELCSHYPGKLIIPDRNHSERASNFSEILSTASASSKRLFSSAGVEGPGAAANHLSDIMQKARFARCRSRFVVPVILYGNKYICRSSTLSSGAEMYGRSGLGWLFSRGGDSSSTDNGSNDNGEPAVLKSIARAAVGDWELFDRVRGEDIRLLKLLGVEYICDLMVEQKKVKFGMTVTSSEKVDKERRYADFRVLSVPYPGCELFGELKTHDYVCDRVHFDWTQPFINTTMDIPADVKDKLSIQWKDYKMWNLTKITQNYLKLFLYLLRTGDGGLLVHCISGWDRTPLFISLIRLSLWADNLIHQSLNASEILYLTLAYDWLLFGHQLSTRLNKGEEILFFCFHFLNQIYSDEYSLFSVHRNRISQCDSEVAAEGVLQGSSHLAGSTSSLSSTGSSGSGSVASSAAVVGAEAVGQSDGLRPSCHSLPQQPRKKPPFFRNDVGPKSVPAVARADKSNPISVPLSSTAANRAENSTNSLYGSWQLISASGSPQGSVTLQGSPLTATQHSVTPPQHGVTPPQHGVTPPQYGITPPTLEIEHNVPSRRQRLDQVRELFLSSYSSTVRTGQEQNATASLAGNIAGMVSRLAGHVGIDSMRGNVA